MAWLYADWDDTAYNDGQQLERLTKHMAEVRRRVGQEMSAGDIASSSYALQRYLKDLEASKKELQAKVDLADMPAFGRLKAVFK